MIKTGNSFKTLDHQFLVNHDSNVEQILESLFYRMDILTLKYNFTLDDILVCKYRPLYTKILTSINPNILRLGGDNMGENKQMKFLS